MHMHTAITASPASWVLLGIASEAVSSVSLDLIQKYFRKVRDYHRAYMEGRDVLEAQSLHKKFKSHRRVQKISEQMLTHLSSLTSVEPKASV